MGLLSCRICCEGRVPAEPRMGDTALTTTPGDLNDPAVATLTGLETILRGDAERRGDIEVLCVLGDATVETAANIGITQLDIAGAGGIV